MIGPLLDTILDRTVIGGYTRVGYRLRRAMWSTAEMQPMGGKVVLLTGGTSGLGLAAAEGFARLGATVRLAVRSQQRGERARAQILASSPHSDVRVGLCDLSDLRSVRQFAERLDRETGRLDVLVNNAGTLTSERTLSADGIELTFATNVLGPFLLTNLLLPLLERSRPARIVNVSSGGMYTQRIHLDDLQMAHEKFDGPTAYARTKRAQVILSELWAQRLRDTGVVVHAMHPGWADTPGLESSLPRFYAVTKRLLRTPQEGADTIVWLGAAARPARSSGGFWHDRRERPTHRVPWTRLTPRDHERLWTECEHLSGWHQTQAPAGSNR
ncbi:MAG TPA: SDR family NAD(P)-dependent oxidoreductase [Solirubrobacteraceae bacterium]|nr:SDR family NAD(P)-dependent oxidoreductase [Solirubrobacteraceae bacterium]